MDDSDNPLRPFDKEKKKKRKGFFWKRKGVNPEDVTEEEILSMINEGHEQGVLQTDEAEMLHNIFEFADTEARDIMIHRKNIAALDGDMSFRKMLDTIESKGYSRYPVYVENIDNIIGVVHIKDILNSMLYHKDAIMDKPIRNLEGLIHSVPFIPETRNISSLFQGMRARRIHMAIVVDEYGQTSGLVTMEDIIEEIMGNIQDEHDDEKISIISQSDGSWLMDGMSPLEDVFHVLSIKQEDILEEYDTLNGFLVSLLGKIPADGEQFSLKAYGYCFNVELVENRLISKVKVIPESMSEEQPGPA